jgi:hypothetical protein
MSGAPLHRPTLTEKAAVVLALSDQAAFELLRRQPELIEISDEELRAFFRVMRIAVAYLIEPEKREIL